MKKFVFGVLAFSTLISGCGSVAETNTAANASNGNTNSNVLIKVDPKNPPPGLGPGPVAPSAESTPGIPPPGSAVNAIPKGVTPTPGIDAANARLKPKPGATPTPGIPSPEEIRRILDQQKGKNPKLPPPPPSSGESMMKKKQSGVNRPNSNN